jgi:2-deoxy-D-gluconate 3-dehydrogenase
VLRVSQYRKEERLETRAGTARSSTSPVWLLSRVRLSTLTLQQLNTDCVGGLNVVAYAAAKHGVQGIVSLIALPCGPRIDTHQQVKSFSNGWAAKGVNVNAIAPGYISTDVRTSQTGDMTGINTDRQMNEALIADPVRSKQILERIPAGRWGTAEDFEGAIVFLASKASDYVSGECLVVDGGWMGRESSSVHNDLDLPDRADQSG